MRRAVSADTNVCVLTALSMSRAAVFTVSPITPNCVPSPTVPAMTRPVLMPMCISRGDRSGRRAARASSAACISSAVSAARLGLVLVRDRCAEDRADGVADELLDVAVVLADDGRELGHRLLHDRVGFFGIELLGHRGEARHVGEERGDAATLAFGEAEARPHVAALGRRCGRRWLHESLRRSAPGRGRRARVSDSLRQHRDRLRLLAHRIGEGAQRRDVRFGPACVERRGSLIGQLFGRAQRSASVLGGRV